MSLKVTSTMLRDVANGIHWLNKKETRQCISNFDELEKKFGNDAGVRQAIYNHFLNGLEDIADRLRPYDFRTIVKVEFGPSDFTYVNSARVPCTVNGYNGTPVVSYTRLLVEGLKESDVVAEYAKAVKLSHEIDRYWSNVKSLVTGLLRVAEYVHYALAVAPKIETFLPKDVRQYVNSAKLPTPRSRDKLRNLQDILKDSVVDLEDAHTRACTIMFLDRQ